MRATGSNRFYRDAGRDARAWRSWTGGIVENREAGARAREDKGGQAAARLQQARRVPVLLRVGRRASVKGDEIGITASAAAMSWSELGVGDAAGKCFILAQQIVSKKST
jgi:hypothetical protein